MPPATSQTTDGIAPAPRSDAGPWIEALGYSHQNLRALLANLSPQELQRPSYCQDWSIAQVISHLGSQAEIFGLYIDAAVRGDVPPGREAFPPIWDAWNSRSPEAQAVEGLQADQATLARFVSMEPKQRQHLRVQIFDMDVDVAGLARMRVGEHAVHTWDVAVALDPDAEVAPAAVALLVDTIGQMFAWAGKPDGTARQLAVVTTDPDRRFVLETGERITLRPAPPGEARGTLTLPAAALIRLVYGRLDPGHTPMVDARQVDLDQLRRMFPGF